MQKARLHRSRARLFRVAARLRGLCLGHLIGDGDGDGSGFDEVAGAVDDYGAEKVWGEGQVVALAEELEMGLVLVPEVPFDLEGDCGLFAYMERRFRSNKFTVIVVAEGAGQHLFEEESKIKDASGNIKHQDIGVFLKDRIGEFFQSKGTEVTIKYIDPSYIIRSSAANSAASSPPVPARISR